MKPSLLAWSLLSLFSISTFATSPAHSLRNPESKDGHRLMKRADAAESQESGPTTFNGVQVPPMRELTPENFEETVKDGYWSGPPRHISPLCRGRPSEN